MHDCIDTMENVIKCLNAGDYVMGGENHNSHGSQVSFPKESKFPNMPIDEGDDRRFMAMPAYIGGPFDMAGMKDTYFVGDGMDYQIGYSFAQEKYVCEKNDKYLAAEGDYHYLFSAGSVVSTAEDVNKWLDVVVSDELFTASDRKKIEKSLMLYNYGWNTSDNMWHHSGRTYLYSSQVFADYHTDTKMVILTNIAFYDNLNQISLAMYLPLVSAAKK